MILVTAKHREIMSQTDFVILTGIILELLDIFWENTLFVQLNYN